ncbi:MAG: DNA topoisomerase IV subunit B, partial [Mycoplasmataceae bacterium]|nr:DNA topoisomerase IV subunit B [Mycoplasmataceae bacterium]
MQEKYTAQNIKVLQGLEAVRKRPGMYIGSTDSRGLHHLIWEIFDNAIDEVYAGNANVISITLHKDNSVSIQDNGRGIPVDINPISNLSGIDTVFTMLHAGGKFDDSNYKAAAGLHGVGSSVVNALSDWLIVKVFRNNTTYESKYVNGGNIKQATLDLKIKSNHTGTLVTFHPDNKIFKSIVFNANLIKERIQEASYLFKGLKIIFKDEINNEVAEYMSKDGLSDYIKFINVANTTISPIISLNGLYKEIGVSVAMQYSEESTEVIVSFANSVKTSDGGSHENGFKSALLKTFNNYIDKWKINTNKNHELELSDLTEGLTCIINVTIPEKLITFEGQTKGRL